MIFSCYNSNIFLLAVLYYNLKHDTVIWFLIPFCKKKKQTTKPQLNKWPKPKISISPPKIVSQKKYFTLFSLEATV